MRRIKSVLTFPFHPLLLASFQILYLYAVNINQANTNTALFLTLISTFFTASIWLLFWLFTRDRMLAGLVASWWCFLFFLYGRIYLALMGITIVGLVIGRHLSLLIIFFTLSLASTLWIVISKRLRQSLTEITSLLNIAALGLVCMAVLTGVFKYDWSRQEDPRGGGIINQGISAPAPSPKIKAVAVTRPNVYFFIFDSYTSPGVLRKYYNWDDNNLTQGLRTMGFTVRENAMSNYPFTDLSLAATLNMTYIHLEPGFAEAKSQTSYLGRHIRHNQTADFFASRGYEVIMPARWPRDDQGEYPTAIKEEKTPLSPLQALLTDDFTLLVVRVSLLRSIERELLSRYLADQISSEIQSLIITKAPPRPTFQFVHIMSPHEPYLFDFDGSRKNLAESVWGRFEKQQGYVNQVRFIGTKILEITANIIKNDPEAVIIIMGDHGHGHIVGDYFTTRKKPPADFLHAQMGILSAVRLPPGLTLPGETSPANLFRYLLNALFAAGLEPLPDRYFFAPNREPYVIHEVTEDIEKLIKED